jgi:hypothetical protein
MFEVGKNYTIRMWEDGEDGGTLIDYDNCEVIEISMPLVKFKQPSNEDMIVNTASLAFVQATLAAMRRTERVVDVEDLKPARLHGRAELVEQSRGEPRRLGLARRILQTTDGRLRCQRCTAVRTAPDRKLHQRIVPQSVEVDRILVPACNRRHGRHHHLEHRVPDAVRIAAIPHRFRKPSAHPELALRLAQQQQASIGRLVAAIKIDCEFLAPKRWQLEGKRCSVGHGGCGARLIREATCRNNDLLRESLALRHSRRRFPHASCIIRVSHGQSGREARPASLGDDAARCAPKIV